MHTLLQFFYSNFGTPCNIKHHVVYRTKERLEDKNESTR